VESAVAHAPATIICTGTYWRNAWKYQARTYRHFGWDNGTLLANMLAVSAASGLPAEIVLGFVDAEVNRLLRSRYAARGFLVPRTDRVHLGEFAASFERGAGARPGDDPAFGA
jgi:hypothetical protein